MWKLFFFINFGTGDDGDLFVHGVKVGQGGKINEMSSRIVGRAVT